MNTYEDETIYARKNLDVDMYRSKLNDLEISLHDLANDLESTQTEYLQDNGYILMTLEGIDILVSEDLSFQELHSSLQQMPAPQDSKEGYALTYLVSTEDLKDFRNSQEYDEIVQNRQNIINDIESIYKEFWNKEVKPSADTDEESIIYMLAGLNKDINSETLSNIININKSKCNKYILNDNDFVVKK